MPLYMVNGLDVLCVFLPPVLYWLVVEGSGDCHLTLLMESHGVWLSYQQKQTQYEQSVLIIHLLQLPDAESAFPEYSALTSGQTQKIHFCLSPTKQIRYNKRSLTKHWRELHAAPAGNVPCA